MKTRDVRNSSCAVSHWCVLIVRPSRHLVLHIASHRHSVARDIDFAAPGSGMHKSVKQCWAD